MRAKATRLGFALRCGAGFALFSQLAAQVCHGGRQLGDAL
jgi:hypothetical protein